VKGFDSNNEATYRAASMRLPRVALVVVVAGLLAIPAHSRAQGDGQDSQPPANGADKNSDTAVKPTRDDARRRIERSARVGDIDASKISTPDKKKNAEKMVSESRGALARVTELLFQARETNDMVQRNCVNEKLTQIKGLLRLSEAASVSMYEAMGKGADDVTNHEYTKIAVAHQKTQLLRTEAEQCVGELSVYTGDTDVTVEIDDDIPQTDPTLPIPPPTGPGTPPVASAF
jgi:phage terminase small subunit